MIIAIDNILQSKWLFLIYLLTMFNEAAAEKKKKDKVMSLVISTIL